MHAGRSALLRDPGPDLHPLIVALDTPTLADAQALAAKVGDVAGAVKIGLELFVAEGPNAVRTIASRGLPIFLDLKLHDIPETVDRAVARACAIGGVSLLTVHASGGQAMLERAASRAEKEATGLTIVAVTVLTSLDEEDLARAGVSRTPRAQAIALARTAASAGVNAFVCSPNEVGALREALGAGAILITPGVRPLGDDAGDQKRTDTPEGAIARGANAVVIGRPIRDAADPREAATRIAIALRANQLAP